MSPQDDSLTLLAQVTDFLTDFFMLAQACSNLQIAGTFTRTRLGFLDYSQQFSAMVAAARSALLSVEALKTHNENTNSNSKARSRSQVGSHWNGFTLEDAGNGSVLHSRTIAERPNPAEGWCSVCGRVWPFQGLYHCKCGASYLCRYCMYDHVLQCRAGLYGIALHADATDDHQPNGSPLEDAESFTNTQNDSSLENGSPQCKFWGPMKKVVVTDIATLCRRRVLELKAEQARNKEQDDAKRKAAGEAVVEDAPPDNIEDLHISVLELRDFTEDLRHQCSLHMKDSYRDTLSQLMESFRDDNSQVSLTGCTLPIIVDKVLAVVDQYIQPHWLELVSHFLDYVEDVENWEKDAMAVERATGKAKLKLQEAHANNAKPEFARASEIVACFQKAGSDKDGDIDKELLFKFGNVRGQAAFQLMRDITEGSSVAPGWSWNDLGKEGPNLCGVRSTHW